MEPSLLERMMTEWAEALPAVTRRGVGTYFGAMVLLDRLIQNYDLDDPSLFTNGGARVSGLNPGKIQSIVLRIAPDDKFECTSIGGRTSPGPALAGKGLIEHLRKLDLPKGKSLRSDLDHCLQFCYQAVLSLQGQEKIKFEFDASKPLQYAFTVLLDRHVKEVKGRALIQHLVGAKLELRFEGLQVGIDRSSVDSRDVNKSGDFEINDYAFHVTVTANLGHIKKCVTNIQREGKRPVLLVPSGKTSAARALADTEAEGDRIDVKSIEAFVSQNVEELALFDLSLLEAKLIDLLQRYNDRIAVAEPGKPYLEIDWSGMRKHASEPEDLQ